MRTRPSALPQMSHMVLLAHPGTQYSHQTARQLVRHDALYEFWTGFAVARDTWSTRLVETLLPAAQRKKIANRIIAGVPDERLRTMPLLEWKAIRGLRNGGSPQQVLHLRNQKFQEGIPNKSIANAAAVIGYDTSSWIIADKTVRQGKPFFLDQSIAHPLANEAAAEEVARRFPDWATTLEKRLPEVLASENLEHKLATRIVVASSYTKRTLVSQGVAPEKILLNPYGVDLKSFHPPSEPRSRGALRFLFLGSVSARKGVPLLLEAWRSLGLKDSELWVVGPTTSKERTLIPELPGLKVLGKWPFEDLPNLLRQCDVLVFPSYCEGFALVLLEALASGMPIITTEATAGPDLIDEGVEGFIIPSGDLEALRGSMQFFVDHPNQLADMSVAARRRAENFSWDSYGDRWQQILNESV